MTAHNKNKIIAAAKKAGAQMRVYKTSPGQDHFLLETEQLERFYAIAFKAGRQAERDAADRIEELTRFIEKQDSLLQEAKPLLEKAAEVRKERDELKADAVRYRWLMNDDGHNALMATLASLCATDDPIKPQMDAAIDAAIANGEKHAKS